MALISGTKNRSLATHIIWSHRGIFCGASPSTEQVEKRHIIKGQGILALNDITLVKDYSKIWQKEDTSIMKSQKYQAKINFNMLINFWQFSEKRVSWEKMLFKIKSKCTPSVSFLLILDICEYFRVLNQGYTLISCKTQLCGPYWMWSHIMQINCTSLFSNYPLKVKKVKSSNFGLTRKGSLHTKCHDCPFPYTCNHFTT